MTLSVGLDFGTSNSSVAVYDGSTLRLVPLDPVAREPSVMRSVLYLTRAGERYVGQEALDRYLAENIGRPVRLERRFVGNVTMTFATVGTDHHAGARCSRRKRAGPPFPVDQDVASRPNLHKDQLVWRRSDG